MPNQPTISLTRLPRILRSRYGAAVRYDWLYRDAVNGVLPIQQGDNGRYFTTEEEIPIIAEILGLLPTTGAAV
jgi:hypothetical protein